MAVQKAERQPACKHSRRCQDAGNGAFGCQYPWCWRQWLQSWFGDQSQFMEVEQILFWGSPDLTSCHQMSEGFIWKYLEVSGKIDISTKKIIESDRAIDATSTKCRRFVGPCRRRRIPGLALGHGPHCKEGVGKRVPKLHSPGWADDARRYYIILYPGN